MNNRRPPEKISTKNLTSSFLLLTGLTYSTDFPVTFGAFDASLNGPSDVFVTKLDSSGSILLFSTFLGGSAEEHNARSFFLGEWGDNTVRSAIALDALGNVYVSGITYSSDFPTTLGAFDTSFNGWSDAFVTKLDSTGSSLVFSTFLGGSSLEEGARGIAVDISGNAYVTGATFSSDFPTTPGAFDTSFDGGLSDSFVTKLNPIGQIVYSTFLGGTSWDGGESIAVDNSGNAYVAGSTCSSDFPTTPGAFDVIYKGSCTAFVTKVDSTGSSLIYSTILGGSGGDHATGIAVDGSGNAYVTGWTNSGNFPTTLGAFDMSFNGGGDAFVTKIDPTGSSLIYSTFFGGGMTENLLFLPPFRPFPNGRIALDTLGNIYFTGNTHSSDFPTTLGVFDTSYNGGGDAFVAKLSLATNTPPTANAGLDQPVHVGSIVTLDGSGSSDLDGNVPLTFAWSIISKPVGSIASLSNLAVVNPTFTPDLLGNYVIQLIVTDSLGAVSVSDTVTISTTNSAPVADAGPDQSIIVIGTTVQLNGTTSFDLDGDPITYQWSFVSKPAGSIAALAGANTATPTFVADVHGDYVVQLVVSDPWIQSLADTVIVSFTNVAPVANAGASQSVVVGTPVTLDGSGSSDANGDILTYSWALTSAPLGSMATIADPTAMVTYFVPDLPGTYVAQLIVNDGFVNSVPSTIQVQAVTLQTIAIQAVQESQRQIASLSPTVFKNPNMQNALLNKLNAVIANIAAGLYADALGQLQNDILAKTNGCANAGAPDVNDWIKDCASQGLIVTVHVLDRAMRLHA